MISIIAILGTIILILSIPLVLQLRNYVYKKHNWKIGWYEDYILIMGLFALLIIHCMITDSILTGYLSIAPFTYMNFRLYKYYWKK